VGVDASMSTRILVDGELWGLIACHHRTPMYLSFEMCSVFELLSNVISAKISAMQQQDLFNYKNQMNGLYARMVENIFRDENLPLSIHRNQEDIMKLLHADGMAVVVNNQLDSYGQVPAQSDIEDLVMWLQTNGNGRLLHQPSLSSVYEQAKNYSEIASGILALPIQPEKGSFILAFRLEAKRKVNWGGDPNRTVNFEAGGKKYHPRNSFNLWQQVVQHTSIPWKPEELDMAEQFRNFIVDYTLNNIYT
jgi:two-component system, chemotaxis family, sensor kinase Cph1